MNAPRRPVLRYHGGKWKLAPWLVSQFPAHRIYVEPFGGAASVLMRKPRSYGEIYNDLNAEVVNVFRVLRDSREALELQRQLELTPFARDELVLSYEPTDCPIERARRTIVRAFQGFGSNSVQKGRTGFRSNSNRSGTTPAQDWANWPAEVPAFIERMRGVVIENRQALEVMRQHDGAGVLHYVDPPYVMDTRNGRDVYTHELDDAEHVTLAGVLRDLGGMVIVSGYDCELYRGLYAGWTRREVDAYADGARPRREVIWMNAAAANAGLQSELGL